MSVHAMRWAAEQSAGGPMPKLVLFALANRATHQGDATASVAALTRDTEASRATVMRALDALVTGGLIVRARRRGDNGADTANTYRLLLGRGRLAPQPVDIGGHR